MEAPINTPQTLGSIAFITSSLFTSLATAQDFLKSGPSVFNYDYAELLYLDSNNQDAIGLGFSADFKDNFAATVSFINNNDFDSNFLSVGVNYHIQTAKYPQADWVFGIAFDTASGNETSDATGINGQSGMRYAVNEELEVSGAIAVSTIFDTDVTIGLRALYKIADGFDALAETSFGDNSKIGLGIRFYWRE